MTSLQIDDFVMDQHEPEKENGEAASLPRRQSPTRRRKLSSKSSRTSSRKGKAPSQPDVIIPQDESKVSKEAEIQIMELREQLVALKVRNRDLEEEMKLVKEKFRKACEAVKDFEDEHTDIQHDLAETKRISSRLEKENDMLRKKAAKREEVNQRLLAQLEKFMGVTGDESSFVRLSFDTASQGDSVRVNPAKPKLTNEQRGNIWKLLADETTPQAHGPISSTDSNGNLLDGFFRTSKSLTSFSELSKSGSSSLSPKNRLQRTRLPSRVGSTAAA